MRVVSLVASATEIVCALGMGDQLVGRSHECDNPQWVKSLPPCSRPAFDISVSSGEIDREVSRRLRSGEPLYEVDRQRIRELAPDLILAQSHCEVCAVTPGDVGLVPGARVVPLGAGTLDGIYADIQRIADALGVAEAGRSVIARERQALADLRSKAAAFRRPSVAMIEWTDPIYPMANWASELVDIANGESALGTGSGHSSAIEAGSVPDADPEFIVIAPCGFDLPRARAELPVLQQHAWWKGLRAVRESKVAFADGNLLFNRSGMTIVQSAQVLAGILHGLEPAHGGLWQWIG